MGEATAISWTDRTWNPWQGCHRVSMGCDACYMFRDKERYGHDPEVIVRSKPRTFNAPLRWQREAAKVGGKHLIFTCSWSDWFIKEADPWRDEAWALIKQTPNLVYQILTKRPARIARCLPKDWGRGYPNVWLGFSAENMEEFNRRFEVVRDIPAAVRFVSVEPMLSRVPLPSTVVDHLDWTIYGGESGTEATSRVCEPEWIREGVRSARETGVSPYVKQMGSVWARKVGAEHPHGANPAEWEEDLRVQEFPAGFVRGTVTLPKTELTVLS